MKILYVMMLVGALLCTGLMLAGISFIEQRPIEKHEVISSDVIPTIPSNYSVNETKLFNSYIVLEDKQCKGKSFYDYKHAIITGNSMLPTLIQGNNILYVPYDNSVDLVSGDIVYWSNDNYTVLHRTIAVYQEYFMMKGDNNVYEDNLRYDYKHIKGIVCGVIYT